MTFDYIRVLPREIWGIVKLLVFKFIATFIKVEDLWLISERGFEAKDNAYYFFVWLRINHPEINAKYVISKRSPDLYKLNQFADDIVFYDSARHYLNLFQASYLVSTHICGFRPQIAIFSELDRRYNILKGQKKVFLQHGIIKDDLKMLYAGQVNLDLFVSGARPEYEFIKSKFGYADNVVKYTGLCRYDNLLSFNVKKQILIMPTWRKYIERLNFKESSYFKNFNSLISNTLLHNVAQKNGYQIIFCPHYEVQPYLHLFNEISLPDNVILADMTYDVQTLLKESQILITDYSSVYFDFAYMFKPILYYQFDKKEFESKHYEKGYFDESSFGPVAETEEDLLKEILFYMENPSLKPIHRHNIELFFEKRDSNNCQRVFNAINEI